MTGMGSPRHVRCIGYLRSPQSAYDLGPQECPYKMAPLAALPRPDEAGAGP